MHYMQEFFDDLRKAYAYVYHDHQTDKERPMTNIIKTNGQVLTSQCDTAVDVILRETARSNPRVHFKEGTFNKGEDTVPLGTEFLADALGWTRVWVKWENGLIVETIARLVTDDVPLPKREELGDTDESQWERNDKTGEPQDPWQLQNILPLEDVETGEYVIFTTSSVGGRIAIEKLCNFVGRSFKQGKHVGGQPVIKLAAKDMPTKYGGTKPRPDFPIVRWHDLPPIDKDMNDEIPYFK